MERFFLTQKHWRWASDYFLYFRFFTALHLPPLMIHQAIPLASVDTTRWRGNMASLLYKISDSYFYMEKLELYLGELMSTN